MDVIKRDGNVVEFDIKKIERAIMSAMETDEQDEYKFRLLIESIQTEIDEYYSDYISIENIQQASKSNFKIFSKQNFVLMSRLVSKYVNRSNEREQEQYERG